MTDLKAVGTPEVVTRLDAGSPGLSSSSTESLVVPRTVSQLLDDAPTSRFHRRAVLISGMGFFTDAYDLFVIGTVAALVKIQWNLSTTQTSWVTGAAILGAFVGAFVFGRIADIFGRKVVYITVAAIMIFGAIASALAPSFLFLVIARLILGLGIGGDYPVSAVLMSEYSNRADRGRLVGLVFSMQAVGLIVGPLVGIVLLSSGVGDPLAWRILLGLGALPAAGVIYFRAKMPEWRLKYDGVENLTLAVMGCIVNGPGESKHADIGISLPGTGETPAAPVFIDGQKAMTLRGDNIPHEFVGVIEEYVARKYAARA